MEYIEPMIIIPLGDSHKNTKPKKEVKKQEDNINDTYTGFSLSNQIINDGENPKVYEDKPAKKKTSNKNSSSSNNIIIPSNKMDLITAESERGLTQLETNIPYLETYGTVVDELDGAINELNELGYTIRNSIEEIRTNKTLKGKHKTLADMSSALSSILGTKISAIKEKNAVITKSHDLDLKRAKELKIGEKVEVDDDRAIANMYEAFIKMPSGGQQQSFYMPPPSDMIVAGVPSGLITAQGNSDAGFNNYMQNITPTQNRMILESNPDIQTVVLFNQETGWRAFDVRNIKTGESIANVPIPDEMFLQDTNIDVANMRANNSNIGESYPLILVNS